MGSVQSPWLLLDVMFFTVGNHIPAQLQHGSISMFWRSAPSSAARDAAPSALMSAGRRLPVAVTHQKGDSFSWVVKRSKNCRLKPPASVPDSPAYLVKHTHARARAPFSLHSSHRMDTTRSHTHTHARTRAHTHTHALNRQFLAEDPAAHA